MTDHSRSLGAFSASADTRYASAWEGRGEAGNEVPDIWHAVAIEGGAPKELAVCGAHYEADHLESDSAFEDKPRNLRCGTCSTLASDPLKLVQL